MFYKCRCRVRLDRHAAPISSEGTGKLVVSLQPAGHSDHLLCPAQLPSALAPVAANGFIGINAIHPAYGGRKSTLVQPMTKLDKECWSTPPASCGRCRLPFYLNADLGTGCDSGARCAFAPVAGSL